MRAKVDVKNGGENRDNSKKFKKKVEWCKLEWYTYMNISD